jgi:membrane protease YdiL (CAAX protease family)
MPDPTELAIIATFSAALGIFVVSAIFQKMRSKAIALPPDSTLELGNESPSSVPHLTEPTHETLPRRVPTWFYQPLDLLGIGFIYLLFFGLVVSSVSAPDKEELSLDSGALLSAIAFQFIGAGIVTFFVISRIRPIDWLGLKWRSWPWVFLIAPCAVAFMWVVIMSLQVTGFMDWIGSFGIDTVQDTVKLLQDSSDPRLLSLMGFAAVIAAPLCEEIIFRGYLYPAAKKFSGPWIAGICSALVFAAAHGNLAALLPLFVFGCLLVIIYEKTGSIWAPIAAHCCFNSATVITQFVARYHHLPLETSL